MMFVNAYEYDLDGLRKQSVELNWIEKMTSPLESLYWKPTDTQLRAES